MGVNKFLKVGYITKVCYLYWLANMVMVKKANDQWCMCVDFIDLNNSYPKDSFHMPKIGYLLDAMVGHSKFSFRNATQDIMISKYLNQIGK